ncbi:hypothetical protein A2997_02270 [Candidatus Nomurabacteria bacterium RIFCSPLOWO2_01_FULL_36_10b]|uniref:Cell division protein FtsL n=1 Tax=Candidatus Nomurabacteria bacterium RIFCSPLOWO2_01_FULL_36_10b TaxID=1801766 RepID=A0A1F6WN40_9BACT|nr:MAG: hypothetical protein A2997_02270 [Candidatus Nomurabacteria bacterium RIFCSPLOWO2_01_FULL_36_10b]
MTYSNRATSSLIRQERKYRIIILVVAVFIAIVLVSILKLMERRAYVKDIRNNREREYQQLLKTQENIQQTVESLQNDGNKERLIREHMRVIKEGEEIIILVPDEE